MERKKERKENGKKTEEVRQDRAHWGVNITGDIYENGWISEMYGYSFGAAEVSLLS